MKKTHFILFGLLTLLFTSPCECDAQRSGKGMLSIRFNHTVDKQPLVLDSLLYKNELGQSYSVTKFKYYISNIQLMNTQGKSISLPGYFLIDEENASSKSIALALPNGEYTVLKFVIGVDSLHNCSGAQSGALDEANGMFWAWNTGYIFLKLEGKSAASTAPGKIFEYHIGGYKAPANAIRTVSLPIEKSIQIKNASTTELILEVNAAELLKTPQSIDFSTMPSVTDTKHATLVADNYKDMFHIKK